MTAMNEENKQTAYRTCSSCGQKKSLTAFKQLSSEGGITYGHICSTCRQAGKHKKVTIDDGTSGTTSELEIGLKAKLQMDHEHHEHEEEVKEANKKDYEEKELVKQELEEKRANIAQKELKHRETYLNKVSFLDSSKLQKKSDNTPDKIRHTTTAQLFVQHAKENADKNIAEKFTQEETDKSTLDLTKPLLEVDVGLIKRHSTTFIGFSKWLGKGAAIVQNTQKILGDITPKEEGPTNEKGPSSKRGR